MGLPPQRDDVDELIDAGREAIRAYEGWVEALKRNPRAATVASERIAVAAGRHFEELAAHVQATLEGERAAHKEELLDADRRMERLWAQLEEARVTIRSLRPEIERVGGGDWERGDERMMPAVTRPDGDGLRRVVAAARDALHAQGVAMEGMYPKAVDAPSAMRNAERARQLFERVVEDALAATLHIDTDYTERARTLDRLQSFLYRVARDHLPTGVVEEHLRVVVDSEAHSGEPTRYVGQRAAAMSVWARLVAETLLGTANARMGEGDVGPDNDNKEW